MCNDQKVCMDQKTYSTLQYLEGSNDFKVFLKTTKTSYLKKCDVLD